MIEFKLLTGPELNTIDPDGISWPFDTFAWVALEDGKLVGRSAILNLPVIEGTMVVPEKRSSTLARRLIEKVEQLYKSLGKTHSWAMAANAEIGDYLERIGYEKVPVTLYSKKLEN